MTTVPVSVPSGTPAPSMDAFPVTSMSNSSLGDMSLPSVSPVNDGASAMTLVVGASAAPRSRPTLPPRPEQLATRS